MHTRVKALLAICLKQDNDDGTFVGMRITNNNNSSLIFYESLDTSLHNILQLPN